MLADASMRKINHRSLYQQMVEAMHLEPAQRQEIILKLHSRMAAWKATGVQRPLMEQAIDFVDYVLEEVDYQLKRNE